MVEIFDCCKAGAETAEGDRDEAADGPLDSGEGTVSDAVLGAR